MSREWLKKIRVLHFLSSMIHLLYNMAANADAATLVHIINNSKYPQPVT
jgi:hypothetical protein